jgi:hypothetical protein
MSKGLQVVLGQGRLVISIPVKDLTFAAENREGNFEYDESVNDYKPAGRVTNKAEFASEVRYELCREEEDGSTRLTRMFDAAFEAAIENGCFGWEEI